MECIHIIICVLLYVLVRSNKDETKIEIFFCFHKKTTRSFPVEGADGDLRKAF